MKTQFKVSYFTATGLKGTFYEFHTTERFDLNILGGYMKDVVEVKVQATGLTTDNIEAERMKFVPHILNFVSSQRPAPQVTQDQIDMLDLGTFVHDGEVYAITSPSGTAVATKTGETRYVPFVSNTFYPN